MALDFVKASLRASLSCLFVCCFRLYVFVFLRTYVCLPICPSGWVFLLSWQNDLAHVSVSWCTVQCVTSNVFLVGRRLLMYELFTVL